MFGLENIFSGVTDFFGNVANTIGGAWGGLTNGSERGSAANMVTNPSEWWDTFKNGETNYINEQIAQQNLEFQREALEKNLAFQRENLDYNKALNQQIMDREDTSYQRTANDMRAAGLNPLTMNGTNGSGGSVAPTEAMHQDALHNDYVHQDKGAMQAFAEIAQMLNGFQDFRVGMDFGREQEAKADSAVAQATIDKATAFDKVDLSHMTRYEKELVLGDLYRNMHFNQSMGIFNGMDDKLRDIRMEQYLRGYRNQTVTERGEWGNKPTDRKFEKMQGYENNIYTDPNGKNGNDYKNLVQDYFIYRLGESIKSSLGNIKAPQPTVKPKWKK